MGDSSSSSSSRPTVSTPPLPETNPNKYVPSRVKKARDWARDALRLSALDKELDAEAERLVGRYADHADKVLEAIEDPSKSVGVDVLKLQVELRQHEVNLAQRIWDYWTKFHTATKTPNLVMVDVEELRDLRLKETLCRYGDYFGDAATELRKHAATDSIEISGRRYWTEISELIGEEARKWKTLDNVEREFETPVMYAVYKANNRAKWDFDHSILAIHMYAERCRVAHTGLEQLVKDGKFRAIASVLWNDLRDMEKLCPENWVEEKVFLKDYIQTKISEWFNADDVAMSPDDPSNWDRTDKLREVIKEKQGEAARKMAVSAGPSVLKGAKGASEHEKALQKQLEERPDTKMPFGVTAPVPPPPGPGEKAKKDPTPAKHATREKEKHAIVEGERTLRTRASSILGRSPSVQTWKALESHRRQLERLNAQAARYRREHGRSSD